MVCIEFNPTNANPAYSSDYAYSSSFIEGGIRTIVLGYASIEIHQETSTPLQVKIYNSSEGLVYSNESSELQMDVSIEGWKTGDYTIVTLAGGEQVSQDFLVSIT